MNLVVWQKKNSTRTVESLLSSLMMDVGFEIV